MSFGISPLERSLATPLPPSDRHMIPRGNMSRAQGFMAYRGVSDPGSNSLGVYKDTLGISAGEGVFSGDVVQPKKSPTVAEWTVPNAPIEKYEIPWVADFYSNPIDWSTNNCIALASEKKCFVLDRDTGKKTEINLGYLEEDLSDDSFYITSVSWSPSGNLLAVSNTKGVVKIWDRHENKVVKTWSDEEEEKVYSIDWQDEEKFTLDAGGMLIGFDINRLKESEETIVSEERKELEEIWTVDTDERQICRVLWSPDRKYLAVGFNGNVVKVYDASTLGDDNPKPLREYAHEAGVKALAWDPQGGNLLATGGGTKDCRIQIFNVSEDSEEPVSRICADAQVCDIVWHKDFIVTAMGFESNDEDVIKRVTHKRLHNTVAFWKLETSSLSGKTQIEKVGSLPNYSHRIIKLAAFSESHNEFDFAAFYVDSRSKDCFGIWRRERVNVYERQLQKRRQEAAHAERCFRRGVGFGGLGFPAVIEESGLKKYSATSSSLLKRSRLRFSRRRRDSLKECVDENRIGQLEKRCESLQEQFLSEHKKEKAQIEAENKRIVERLEAERKRRAESEIEKAQTAAKLEAELEKIVERGIKEKPIKEEPYKSGFEIKDGYDEFFEELELWRKRKTDLKSIDKVPRPSIQEKISMLASPDRSRSASITPTPGRTLGFGSIGSIFGLRKKLKQQQGKEREREQEQKDFWSLRTDHSSCSIDSESDVDSEDSWMR
ncbi:MAG: hypothetical protein HN411_00555 [Waddliaceae bacterium]|jgi:WD40 repeat protein|nr:hypothetical protein [Waddliaceae bacterium]MBT4445577.1 hypothetical protein [Waddliaceae bacterium]MBT6928231.1 hypothetical protein [Waddliaceae bacterium]MBT7264576.1 hypothetical protein [Waddliaceae bacterium]